ncbi:MAG: 6-bladed beta-propeller [Gemmatimonadota bacterium]|nr:6-bladed beta-propeller [Gemmatimonadota bacterium]MDE2871580.1 6-bladed beta-propeller [Gemmatimonadota bacterium]
MHRLTTQHHAKRIVGGTAAFITALAMAALPLPAQDVIELPAADRRLDADFEEIYKLGALDGRGWETFGNIVGVGFDGAGNLYIFDSGAVRIYVVDQQGNLVRQFIGEGEGPGEFGGNYAAGMDFAVMRDSRVAVYDIGRMAFALFDATGEFERTVPLVGPQTHTPMIGGIQAFPGMERVLSTTEVSYLRRTEPGPDDESSVPSFRYVLSYGLSGDQVRLDSVAAGWRPSGDPEAFKPPLAAGVLPSGAVVYTDSSAYAIKFAVPSGGVTRILTRPFQPRRVTEAMKAAELERRLERLGDGGGDPMRQRMIEFRRGQIEAMEFFDEVPVVLALKTSWEGTIWVWHRGDEGTEGSRIDLITPEGRYLGTFAPGSTAMPSAFGPDGLVAFVETDDLDVPYVVVKRLPDGMR